MKEQLKEKSIIPYLLGEDTFNGCWFGEPNPMESKGKFWWRTYLRQEIEKRDKEIEYHAGLSLKNAKTVREIQAEKIKLEERIKELEAQLAADQNQNQ